MPLVVAPAVWALVAGGSAEAAYAWYDPDLFTKSLWSNAELDERVATLNNYWQHLQRSIQGRVPPNSDAAKDIRQYSDGWNAFRKRYNDAIFRRAMDPFGLWGAKADFEQQLNDVWAPRFVATLQKAIAADSSIQAVLAAKNVDVDDYMARSNLNPDGSTKSSNTGLYVGVGVTILLIGIGALLASRK